MFERRTLRSVGWGVTGAVALALTAVGPAVGPASAAVPVPARYAEQQLAWQPCAQAPSLECAAMTVPMDWHHPDGGRDITVEVSRHQAADPAQRRGVLMMAAGGPGGSGLTRPAQFVRYSTAVAAAYDVVGFDQRGVGQSTPARCQSDAEFQDFFAGDFRDRSPAAIHGVLDRSRQLAAGCLQRSGDLLPYLTTDQTVHDMDLFRALLGAPKISYYGPSYATMIGAYYATEFPQRVERVVLDSNIEFTGSWQTDLAWEPMSFQRRFEQDFLPWVARYDSVYHLGATADEAKAGWERLRRSLAEQPVTVGSAVVAPNQLDNGAILAMYNAGQGFEPLATALAGLEHWADATPAERQAVSQVFLSYLSPGFTAEFFAITCNDTPWTRSQSSWVRRSAKDAAAYPLMGARELAFASVCADWPVAPAPHIEVTGAGLPTVLMLNSVHDPATSYEGAVRAHQQLRGSRLVTVTGGGDHVQYQNHNACVDGIVDRYLLTGTAPAQDTSCPADPLPVPTPSPTAVGGAAAG